ncbi:hypothetical protein ACJX0J_015545, partial [Zea mays]
MKDNVLEKHSMGTPFFHDRFCVGGARSLKLLLEVARWFLYIDDSTTPTSLQNTRVASKVASEKPAGIAKTPTTEEHVRAVEKSNKAIKTPAKEKEDLGEWTICGYLSIFDSLDIGSIMTYVASASSHLVVFFYNPVIATNSCIKLQKIYIKMLGVDASLPNGQQWLVIVKIMILLVIRDFLQEKHKEMEVKIPINNNILKIEKDKKNIYR